MDGADGADDTRFTRTLTEEEEGGGGLKKVEQVFCYNKPFTLHRTYRIRQLG